MSATSNHLGQETKAPPRRITVGSSTRRGIAGLVDTLFCVPLWALLTWLTWPGQLPDVPWNWLDTLVDWVNASPAVLWAPAVWILVVGFAYNLAFGMRGLETPGKRLLKLTTEDADGRFPDRRRLIWHAAAKLLSTILLLGGHLWALADPERRTLHDRLTGIWVVSPDPELDTGKAARKKSSASR